MTLTRWFALAFLLAFVLALYVGRAEAEMSSRPLRSVDDLEIEKKAIFPPWSQEDVRGGPLAPVMVREGVLFRIGAPDADRVSVVGDFNDWDQTANQMRRTRGGVWRTTIDMKPGERHYLFIVDGNWTLDPDNPLVRNGPTDEFAEASMIRIKRGEVALPKQHGQHEATAFLSGTYERVDAVILWGGLSYENRTELHPRLKMAGGYSFGRQLGLFHLAIDQPLLDVDLLDVGLETYRITDTPDSMRFGNVENTLATFFFRQDWRDYHATDGASAHAKLYLGSIADFTVRWRSDEKVSLPKVTDWGVFGGDMRDNPVIIDGTVRTLGLGFDLDTRNDTRNPTRGALVDAAYTWAGGRLGGDFEYQKATIDLRRYAKLSTGHWFDFRIIGGAIEGAENFTDDGVVTGYEAIPVQERFFLGGLGTMRAQQFKSIQGDRMLLGNMEMRVEIFRDLLVAVFTDIGDAWIEETERFDIKYNAGIGLQDADASFRIDFAKKLGQDDDTIWITSRIQRTF